VIDSSIDHDPLFNLLEEAAGEVMLTYDDAKEVRDLRLHMVSASS
jgi:hypothetical protein